MSNTAPGPPSVRECPPWKTQYKKIRQEPTEEGGASTFYADADADGYGDPDAMILACAAPDGTVGNADDCDDRDDSVHPDAEELCDGEDQDCDGDIDDGFPVGAACDAEGACGVGVMECRPDGEGLRCSMGVGERF